MIPAAMNIQTSLSFILSMSLLNIAVYKNSIIAAITTLNTDICSEESPSAEKVLTKVPVVPHNTPAITTMIIPGISLFFILILQFFIYTFNSSRNLKLTVIEGCVKSVFLHKLVMCSLLDDISVFNAENKVGIFDG